MKQEVELAELHAEARKLLMEMQRPGPDKHYWTMVSTDCGGYVETYERALPHGMLVLTVMKYSNAPACSMVFVPAAPHPGQERL